jgi:hypothetical protein
MSRGLAGLLLRRYPHPTRGAFQKRRSTSKTGRGWYRQPTSALPTWLSPVRRRTRICLVPLLVPERIPPSRRPRLTRSSRAMFTCRATSSRPTRCLLIPMRSGCRLSTRSWPTGLTPRRPTATHSPAGRPLETTTKPGTSSKDCELKKISHLFSYVASVTPRTSTRTTSTIPQNRSCIIALRYIPLHPHPRPCMFQHHGRSELLAPM